MSADPQETERLAERLRAFEQSVVYGRALRLCLEAAGSSVADVVPVQKRDDTWLLRVRLGAQLSKRFRTEDAHLAVGPGVTDRAVLHELLASGATGQFHAPPLYVTVHDDDFVAYYVQSPLLHHEAQHVGWWWIDDWEDADSTTNDGNQWVAVLSRALREDDIFEQRNPVPVLAGVTRRRWEEGFDLAHALERGASLGCFGLRKVGKTSLVQSCRRDVEFRSEMAEHFERVAWVDLQGLTMRTLPGLCDAVLRALGAAASAGGSALSRLDEALSASAAAGRPTWLVLDEYDLLFASPRGRGGVEGVERFFSLLRAHAQRSRLLSLVVIGRDPSHAQRPTMEAAPNPLLGWLSTRWVGPLVESDARALFSTLARRVCLDAGPATLDAALRWSGGHPMLLRQFGSSLLSVARTSIRDDGPLPTDPFVERALDAFLERDAVLEMCREVEHLLADVYPDAASFFWRLVGDLPPEDIRDPSGGDLRNGIEQLGGWRSPAAQTLRNLGLLQGPPEAPTVPELWCWWSAYVTWRPSASAG